ncbi:MAG: hypothetical protein ACO1O3_19715, partial [Sphingobium sp.]
MQNRIDQAMGWAAAAFCLSSWSIVMDLAGLAVFSIALLVAAASPGPGIAAIIARVLGRGPNGAA